MGRNSIEVEYVCVGVADIDVWKVEFENVNLEVVEFGNKALREGINEVEVAGAEFTDV